MVKKIRERMTENFTINELLFHCESPNKLSSTKNKQIEGVQQKIYVVIERYQISPSTNKDYKIFPNSSKYKTHLAVCEPLKTYIPSKFIQKNI